MTRKMTINRMFETEDLPLFSGTAPRVEDIAPSLPIPDPWTQPRLIRQTDMAELAEEHRQARQRQSWPGAPYDPDDPDDIFYLLG